jgi:predicted amidohydrolase YtcJ
MIPFALKPLVYDLRFWQDSKKDSLSEVVRQKGGLYALNAEKEVIIRPAFDEMLKDLKAYGILLVSPSGHHAWINSHLSEKIGLVGSDETLIRVAGDQINMARRELENNNSDRFDLTLKSLVASFHRLGFTGATVYSIRNDMIDRLAALNVADFRINGVLDAEESSWEWMNRSGGISEPYLRIKSMSMYVDGGWTDYSALLIQPYADSSGYYGKLASPLEKIKKNADLFESLGFQLYLSAYGDSAVRIAADVMREELGEVNDRRWVIDGVQILDGRSLSNMKQVSLIPSVQSIWLQQAETDLERLGHERVENSYPLKELFDVNHNLVNGSVFPLGEPKPFRDIQLMVSIGLDRVEAYKAYSYYPAQSAFMDSTTGSLEPGKSADFVILSRDPFHIPKDQISDIFVKACYFEGRRVSSE